MTEWQAFLLGVVQGITEFLPVSSSGHLALGQYFLGFDNLQNYTLFNLICHLGTLTAILYVFFPIIKETFTGNTKKFFQVILATLPLFPLVLILKPLKALFDHPQLLGPCFLISAALLFTGIYYRIPRPSFQNRTWKDPLAIGLFQAAAIFPGISRSGATISAARILGWDKEQAIQFSFLLAIPTILGGTILEGWQVWKGAASATPATEVLPMAYVIGFLTSCLFGCLSLGILIRLVKEDKWNYFAWYCLLLGAAVTIYFNL